MKNHPEVSATATQLSARRAIAYYRSSIQDGQKNSIDMQKDQVRQWAKERDIEIMHEFCEAGPSETKTQERPVFTEMLEEWIKPRFDFEHVLCFDASRLGRYSDSVHLQSSAVAFEQYRKQVTFTSMGK
jgi:DNA invertase Pin-like site-specific DNA recombinase